MKIAYLLACVGLFGCTQPFSVGTGGSSSASTTGVGGSSFVPPPTGTVTADPPGTPDAGGNDAGDNDASVPDAGDCSSCPSQIQGYPSSCIDNTCQPISNTIFSPACGPVCGNMNMGAWDDCLMECYNQSCTVQQACTNCNFLYSAEPDCLSCLHTNFPGQSCGG